MPKYEFSTVRDALVKIDTQVDRRNYASAMSICSHAITFFCPAPIEVTEALKAKIKIIKASRSLVDENPSYSP